MIHKILIPLMILLISGNVNTFAQNLMIKERVESYNTITLTEDLTWLSESEKKIIPILIDVAKIMDDLFWLQNYGEKSTEVPLLKIHMEPEKYSGASRWKLF